MSFDILRSALVGASAGNRILPAQFEAGLEFLELLESGVLVTEYGHIFKVNETSGIDSVEEDALAWNVYTQEKDHKTDD